MDSDRWEQISTLFHDAATLPAEERRTFVKRECAADEDLAAEVLGLLEEDARSDSMLDVGLSYAAHEVFGKAAGVLFSPREFGPYQIKGVLGEGGMGVVYLAEREDLQVPVAIKILRDAWLSPARRERFESEQRLLAQLNHPSIARLYDADALADGTPWFVMEYVDGVPLAEYCRRNDCPVTRRLELFRSVCEAVRYAHGLGVIHRDLKPSNILVKEDGGVRLLDFGIAKQLTSPVATVDQTRTGLRLMTPAYAPPEQIRGEPVGVRADVYSLGVILYELLTGRLPFDLLHRAPGEAESVILACEPEKPSVIARSGSPPAIAGASKAFWADLDVLCLVAMRKDLDRRYQSVEALMRDVDHYVKGEPLEARPDSIRYTLGKLIRRRKRVVVAAGVVTATLAALVVFYTIRLTYARNAALGQAARTQRIQQFMLNLFQAGDPSAAPADNLRVVTLLERGIEEARTLDKEPEVQAELYQTLGSIYLNLGSFARADSLLNAALEKRRSAFGRDHREVATTLGTVALLRAKQGKFKEAEQLAHEALDIDRRYLPPGDPEVAKAMCTLGLVLEDRGAYSEAIRDLDEAVRLQSASGAVNADLAASLTELANSHFYAGHYDISDALNRRALAMDRQLHGPRHPLVADILLNLGATQFNLGHYADAERYDREALEINKQWYGDVHPEVAASLAMVGQALGREGRYDEAESVLNQALAIQERVYGPVHFRVALAVNELGTLSQIRGHLDEAEARFRRAVDIYRAVYGEHHYAVIVAMSNLAGVSLERKEYGRAEQLFKDVLKRATETLSPDHLQTGIVQVKLGRTLLREKHYSEAEDHLLAGYTILKKVSPSSVILQSARKDLAALYEASNRPERSASFRAELQSVASTAGGVKK